MPLHEEAQCFGPLAAVASLLPAALCLIFLAWPSLLAAGQGDANPPAANDSWKSLFDGRTLGSWKAATGIDYDHGGQVRVEEGHLLLQRGQPATGVRWTGEHPKLNYELSLQAKRVEGSDFFCGLSFPVGDQALTLIVGGWGGSLVGLSCIDGYRAVDNDTCLALPLEQNRWYKVLVRVTRPRVEVWLDEERVIELAVSDQRLEVTDEMEPCLPLGIATWYTTAAIRDLKLRSLPE